MNTEQLMATKLKTNTNIVNLSKKVLELLDDLEQHVPEDKKVLFNRSIKQPHVTKYQKAAGSALFWQDKESVERWIARKQEEARQERAGS